MWALINFHLYRNVRIHVRIRLRRRMSKCTELYTTTYIVFCKRELYEYSKIC